MTVESPCVRLCTLNADDVCVGCGRTIDEICAWSESDDERRLEIVARAGERLAVFRARAGVEELR